MVLDTAVDEIMAGLSMADEPSFTKPDRLRRRPQENQIGHGKRYENRAAFEDDLVLHDKEKAQHEIDYK